MVRVLLVGTQQKNEHLGKIEDQLNELCKLVNTLDYSVVGSIIAPIKEINPRTFIGKGKALEISEKSRELSVDVIIFNDDLSPSQHFALEKIFDKTLLERSEVILEIFSKNARTKISKTQVELAQLRYMLPRLKRRWVHLERQRGGIGHLRGVGEKQLEIDRRIIYNRISKLKKELKQIDIEQETQRKKREILFKVCLVGYTNSGKSTILKALTGYDAFIEDKLFATLDSKVKLLGKKDQILLTDTVGFIRKLPEHLFTSFKSTLLEIVNADLLLLVSDISDPGYQEHIIETKKILNELNAIDKPTIYIFNKIDKNGDEQINQSKRLFPGALYISAVTCAGILELKDRIKIEFNKNMIETSVKIPYNKYSLIKIVREKGKILKEEYMDDFIILSFSASVSDTKKIREEVERLV